MSKENNKSKSMSEIPNFSNYRSAVNRVLLSNRGKGSGFNLYFDCPPETGEDDTRPFGIHLTQTLAVRLVDLFLKAIEKQDDDIRGQSVGVYALCHTESNCNR